MTDRNTLSLAGIVHQTTRGEVGRFATPDELITAIAGSTELSDHTGSFTQLDVYLMLDAIRDALRSPVLVTR